MNNHFDHPFEFEAEHNTKSEAHSFELILLERDELHTGGLCCQVDIMTGNEGND